MKPKQNFVITGKLEQYTRTEMIDKITKAGGYVHDRITHDIHFLIVGNTGRHGKTNKMQDAEDKGVKLMTEECFVEMDIETLKEYIQGLKDLNEILDVFK